MPFMTHNATRINPMRWVSLMAEDWHLDKKVPVALIGSLLVQTFGFGVWAENLSLRIGDLERVNPGVALQLGKLNDAREALRLDIQTQTNALNSLSAMLAERTKRFDDIQDSLVRLEHRNAVVDKP